MIAPGVRQTLILQVKTLRFLLTLFFLAGCQFSSSLRAEESFESVLKSEVLSSPEYAKAKRSDLVLQELSRKVVPSLTPELRIQNKEERSAIESDVSEMLKRLGFPVPDLYLWQASSSSDYVRSEGRRVFCAIDHEKMSVKWLLLTQVEPFPGSMTYQTPEAFLRYARETYRKIFQEEVMGEVQFRWDGVGMRRFENETVSWNMVVEGVSLGGGSFEVGKKGESGYQLSCGRVPGKEEVKNFKNYLIEHPMKITRRDAMAIVLKTWEKLGRLPENVSDKKVFVQCQGKKIEAGDRRGPTYHNNEIYWEKPEVTGLESDLYAYEVTINDGLFQIAATVAWDSGEILWMRQGTMGW